MSQIYPKLRAICCNFMSGHNYPRLLAYFREPRARSSRRKSIHTSEETCCNFMSGHNYPRLLAYVGSLAPALSDSN